MDRCRSLFTKRRFRLSRMLVLGLTLGVVPGAYVDAHAASRRSIYRDMFGNDLGPDIPPPRTAGGGWAIYNDGAAMGFSTPSSSQGFRNYGLHNNLGDAFWPPY